MELKTQTAGSYEFASNGSSSSVNALGMRPMQAKAFEVRDSQYILIKAPPACGKSRALMFIALDKLNNQGIEKVIVAVPQKAIGSSFKSTVLKGFGYNWEVNPQYDLCSASLEGLSDASKSKRVKRFFEDPEAKVLVCAHPTLINFHKSVADEHIFDKTLVAIDEFHHVSADEDNRLGAVIQSLMSHTSAHIVAMTGSYFRGDRIPVLSGEDEDKFTQVIYTYYEQLNGYTYLKKLKLDYSFFDGNWLDGLDMFMNPAHKPDDYSGLTLADYQNPAEHCFDPDLGRPHIDLKTIIYIPSVQSMTSTGDKRNEFVKVCEILGKDPDDAFEIDDKTGFYIIKSHYGKTLKIANLVHEESQAKTIDSLRKVSSRDDVDIIIALGMAKEGFDWPWCEHVIVAGFRNSLTELIQIIGRATRDCEGKTMAKFTNLVKAPDAVMGDVQAAVDDLLKAISLSLMMEQVLQPNIKFVPRSEASLNSANDDKDTGTKTIVIDDEQLSPYTKELINTPNAILDLATHTLNNLDKCKSAVFSADETDLMHSETLHAAVINTIKDRLPDNVSPEDSLLIAKLICAQLTSLNKKPKDQDQKTGSDSKNGAGYDSGSGAGTSAASSRKDKDSVELSNQGNALLELRKHLIDVGELDFTLIEHCNPFGDAYEFISRVLDAPLLKKVQEYAINARSKVTAEEAKMMWGNVKEFLRTHGRNPDLKSKDPYERRLAEIVNYVVVMRQNRNQAS